MTNKNNTTWIVVVIVVVALLFFVMPFGGGRWGGFHGMMGSYYGYNMMGGLGWILMPVVFVALVLLIIWLINQLQNPRRK